MIVYYPVYSVPKEIRHTSKKRIGGGGGSSRVLLRGQMQGSEKKSKFPERSLNNRLLFSTLTYPGSVLPSAAVSASLRHWYFLPTPVEAPHLPPFLDPYPFLSSQSCYQADYAPFSPPRKTRLPRCHCCLNVSSATVAILVFTFLPCTALCKPVEINGQNVGVSHSFHPIGSCNGWIK